MRHHVTSGDRTHLLFWSRWKPAVGGDHGVSVFLGVCCLLFFCVVHEVTVWLKSLSLIVRPWFCGFAPLVWWVWNKPSYVGFSIEKKIANLNSTLRFLLGYRNLRRNSMRELSVSFSPPIRHGVNCTGDCTNLQNTLVVCLIFSTSSKIVFPPPRKNDPHNTQHHTSYHPQE